MQRYHLKSSKPFKAPTQNIMSSAKITTPYRMDLLRTSAVALWYIVLAVLGGFMVLNLLVVILYQLFKNENRKPVEVTSKMTPIPKSI